MGVNQAAAYYRPVKYDWDKPKIEKATPKLMLTTMISVSSLLICQERKPFVLDADERKKSYLLESVADPSVGTIRPSHG